MTEPFRLEPDPPPKPGRFPYQTSRDGEHWTPLSEQDLRGWLEHLATYPDHKLDDVHRGATVRLRVRGALATSGPYRYFRRTPTPAEAADQRAQLTLL